MTLFVDSSAWFAAANDEDRWNQRAREIIASRETLVTSDHVLVESWLLIHSRMHREAAERFWEGLRAGVARIEKVGPTDLETAWSIGLLFADQDFSIVDRTSFALMERLGLTRAVSFDSDFAVYRYGRNRDRAFELIR
ncbi:MAG TPA: PIN domain-containing protein [Thermoanaerobaculia bacterium]|jgi:predicted nucleic acid-binding protein|nr:PIN domain-containing protein [Thermoanaerobaculia bacterium]